jgi:hypothetical protein
MGSDQMAAGKIISGFTQGYHFIFDEDREILRRLSGRVADIAASARMKTVGNRPLKLTAFHVSNRRMTPAI